MIERPREFYIRDDFDRTKYQNVSTRYNMNFLHGHTFTKVIEHSAYLAEKQRADRAQEDSRNYKRRALKAEARAEKLEAALKIISDPLQRIDMRPDYAIASDTLKEALADIKNDVNAINIKDDVGPPTTEEDN